MPSISDCPGVSCRYSYACGRGRGRQKSQRKSDKQMTLRERADSHLVFVSAATNRPASASEFEPAGCSKVLRARIPVSARTESQPETSENKQEVYGQIINRRTCSAQQPPVRPVYYGRWPCNITTAYGGSFRLPRRYNADLRCAYHDHRQVNPGFATWVWTACAHTRCLCVRLTQPGAPEKSWHVRLVAPGVS